MSIKYMVAAHTSQRGVTNKEFTIHETTVLPSIRGFGPLMAMIFCRSLDLKRDQTKSRYISLRTGLGYNADKSCPYYAERDTLFPLDFEFEHKDLELVSKLHFGNELPCIIYDSRMHFQLNFSYFFSENVTFNHFYFNRLIKFVTTLIVCCFRLRKKMQTKWFLPKTISNSCRS